MNSLILLSLAAFFYAIKELQSHGKLRWMKGGITFWGPQSFGRKYHYGYGMSFPTKAPNTFYYRTFKLAYKERWPTSATFTVFLTDGYHLCQFFFTILFCLSAVSYRETFGYWWDGGIYWGLWHIIFPITYKIFSK